MLIKVNDREHATILAALRLYQSEMVDDRRSIPNEDIASNGGAFKPLDEDDIDDLCERINTEGITHTLAIGCCEGIDIYLGTEPKLIGIAAQYARNNWADIESDTDEDPPEDDSKCALRFFNSPATFDTFTINTVDHWLAATETAERK